MSSAWPSISCFKETDREAHSHKRNFCFRSLRVRQPRHRGRHRCDRQSEEPQPALTADQVEGSFLGKTTALPGGGTAVPQSARGIVFFSGREEIRRRRP